MGIQKDWLKSRKANYQKELGRQNLEWFAKGLFYLQTNKSLNKDCVDFVKLADYLISLGICPDINFLYKVNKVINEGYGNCIEEIYL